MARISEMEREVYSIISSTTRGISPGNLSKQLKVDLFEIKRLLSNCPLFTGLCYKNSKGNYCPMISMSTPHYGLENYSWYYSSAASFLNIGENVFMEKMEDSCINTATIIGTPRFPQKMTKMIRCSMVGMFKDIEILSGNDLPIDRYNKWETAFHVNIATPRSEIKMSCDVFLITDSTAYPIIFVNTEKFSDKTLSKIIKRTDDFSVIMGSNYRLIPVVVMIGSSETFQTVSVHSEETGCSYTIPTCSRDMLYRILTDFQ